MPRICDELIATVVCRERWVFDKGQKAFLAIFGVSNIIHYMGS